MLREHSAQKRAALMIWENCVVKRKRNGAIFTFLFFPSGEVRTAEGGLSAIVMLHELITVKTALKLR
ncbi:hypothetical protein FACS189491_06530 [Spirochaetia bacterium]|nr:hypothetical protein FACS189491_06530 [Spirochaetia bacterium]